MMNFNNLYKISIFIVLIVTLPVSLVHAKETKINLSSETINSYCKNTSTQIIRDPSDETRSVGSIKCVDDPSVGQKVFVYGEKSQETQFNLEGEYLQTLVILADSVSIKNFHSPHSLSIQGEKLTLEGKNIIPVDFNLNVKKINFNEKEGDIISKTLTINGDTFNNSSVIQNSFLNIKSATVNLNKNSVLSSKNDITISASKLFVNDGVIKSNTDITIDANSAKLNDSAKIFSNGIYRIKISNGLKDQSTTVARKGASYFARNLDLQAGYYFLGEVISIVADDIGIDSGAFINIARGILATKNAKMAEITFSGNINVNRFLNSGKGMREMLSKVNASKWFAIPDFPSQSSDINDFKGIEGIQFIVGKYLETTKLSSIGSDQGAYLSSDDKMILDGSVRNSSDSSDVILKSQDAKLMAKIESSKDIFAQISGKLESSSQMMAKEYLTILAGELTLRTPSILSSGTNIKVNVSGSATIDGKSKTNGSITIEADKRFEVSGEHTASTEMHLTSKKDKVVIKEEATLKYDSAIFTGALGVENSGTRIGKVETIDAPEVFERGKIKVERTTYKKGNIYFSGSLSESKLLKIENAGIVEFSSGSDVKSNSIDIKSAKLSIANNSNLEGGVVDLKSDYAKIEGALNSLGTLTYNGNKFHLENGGVITGKGNILIHGELVELKKDSEIKSSDGMTVISTTNGNIAGVIKGKDGTVITGLIDNKGNVVKKLENLTLANSADIEGSFVQIQVGGILNSDAKITANGNQKVIINPDGSTSVSVDGQIIFKLDTDQAKNLRGHLKANGWIMLDGKLNSEAVASLLVDRKDIVEAQGLRIITTEPIIIQKEIRLNHGLSLDASSVTMDKDSRVNATEISLNAREGNITLESASKIEATKNVSIIASGDIIRKGEELSDKSIAISSIKSQGGDILILSTDGSYHDTAAETKTTGKLIIQTKKGIVITPIKQVFISESVDETWYGKKTTTSTTTTKYTGSKMDASELSMDSGEGKMDITNLRFNGEKITPNQKNIFLSFPDGLVSLDYLEDSVISTSKNTYGGLIKPFINVIETVAIATEQGRDLTRKLLRIGEKILREISKPITANIKGSDKYLDRFMNIANSSLDFTWDLTNPEKFYKVDTYKEHYNGVKTVAVEIIQDVASMEGKLVKKLNHELLRKFSNDLANMVDDTIKIQNKGIHYLAAAASFENVARTALITFSTACGGGPAGAALANLIADRFIERKTLTVRSFIQNVAVGATAGYVAEYASGCKTLKESAPFIGNLSQNAINDAGNIIINGQSYTSADFIAMTLRSGASSTINIKNGSDASISRVILTGATREAVNSGTKELIKESVIDHHLDMRDVGDLALRGATTGLVDSSVTSTTKEIYSQIPKRFKPTSIMSDEEMKRLDGRLDYFIAKQTLAGLEQGLKVLIDGLSRLQEDQNQEGNKEGNKESNFSHNLKTEIEQPTTKKDNSTVDSNLTIGMGMDLDIGLDTKLKPTYLGYEFNPSTYDLDPTLREKWKITFNPDTELNPYAPSLLDKYGFIKDLSLGEDQRKFISNEMGSILPKESHRLKMQLNSWDFKNLNNNQVEVINQIGKIQSAYDDIKNIPLIYDDRNDLLKLENIIFSQSYGYTVTASQLSKDDTGAYQVAYEKYMKKGKLLVDSGISLYQAHESDNDPFSIDFHKGYYKGLVEGAKISMNGFVDFITQPKEDLQKFSQTLVWAIENPKEAAKIYKENIELQVYKFLTAKSEEKGKLVGEFAGSFSVDYLAGEAVGSVVNIIKDAEFAKKVYRGLTKHAGNEIGSIGLNGISIGVKTENRINPYSLNVTHQTETLHYQKVFDQIKKDGLIKETIKFVEYNGEKYIVDGHHRVRAAKELKIKDVPIEKVELPYKGYKKIEDLFY
ncbi:MAG: ParB N-terminal domain-containing protein [Oligoflexia bacterium]|nr:ParB N-terminal domain-containing protein [Oligoflexia bacterium]